MGGAAILIAHQVAAKAIRDSLFLETFSAADLPKIMGAAAVVAVISALLFARLLLHRNPTTVLTASLLLSALVHLSEFFLLPNYRGPVVVFIYLHIISSSSLTLSLFWSITSDAFSPGEGKRFFGRITAAGTAGGIAGGLLAARLATAISVDSILVLLAVLQAAAAGAVLILGRYRGPQEDNSDGEGFFSTVRLALQRAPFLKKLALLVLLSTISGAIVDFLFKSGAASIYSSGPALTSFFALFHTGTQGATFLIQVAVTPYALRMLGLGRTVMTLPMVLASGGLASLFAPLFVSLASTRIGETVLKGSLFRAGYELFFTAIPSSERRAVKTAIDVGCDRAGEVLAAGVIQAFLVLGPDAATRPLLLITTVFAGACVWICARMDPAYLRALEQGLLHRAIKLNEADVQDSTTLSALMRSLPHLAAIPEHAAPAALRAEVMRSTTILHDPTLEQLRILRSGVAADVRKALAPSVPFDPLMAPQIIRLLAWDEVTDHAREYLAQHAQRVGGQLADALNDARQDFSLRRRIPRILARVSTQQTVEALLAVLDDPRFEIRFHSSRALEFLHRSTPELHMDSTRLMQIVERELSVSRRIWEDRRLLDKRDDSDGQLAYLDEVLQDRADQSMEHVFSLLALMLPKEPLKVAFRALHGEDRLLRGLGLEYLETVLPAEVFDLFRKLLEVGPVSNGSRSAQAVVDELMASQQLIHHQIRTASGDAPAPDPRPRPTTPA
jgi:ATP/ADP translocase